MERMSMDYNLRAVADRNDLRRSQTIERSLAYFRLKVQCRAPPRPPALNVRRARIRGQSPIAWKCLLGIESKVPTSSMTGGLVLILESVDQIRDPTIITQQYQIIGRQVAIATVGHLHFSNQKIDRRASIITSHCHRREYPNLGVNDLHRAAQKRLPFAMAELCHS